MNRCLKTSVLLSVAFSTIISFADEAAEPTEYDWPYYASDQGSSKYAHLDQINKDTVASLATVWVWDSPDSRHIEDDDTHIPAGFKSTPIKIGSALYTSTSLGYVAAIDATTGEQRWVFDTRTWEDGRPANMGFNHRGVAYWTDGTKHRILIGTNNAYLWSLDAATGVPDKTFGNNGKVDLTKGWGREIDRKTYSVTAAPVIVADTVVFGGVVSDAPLAGLPPGDIRGYDVNTGKQKWIFHSIPRAGEPGTETWKMDSWKVGGGTNAWSLISADPDLGYIYLPFGSPSNDWYGGERQGDNLYGNSLVCLNASNGKLVWHFQTVHHDLWDYDLPAAPTLVDITVDGKPVKAVAQVSKQGFLYVFNRIPGEPIWPIEERAVPQTTVPGEQSSPTQPIPTWPKPFELQGISEDDLIDFTPELRAEALQIISQYDYGEVFTPPSLKGTINMPGFGGGAEWTGAAFDPHTSLYYIPSTTSPMVVTVHEQGFLGRTVAPAARSLWMRITGEIVVAPGGFRYQGDVTYIRGPGRLPVTKPPYTRVSAVDLNTGEYKWVVANGDGMRQRIIDRGLPDPGPVGGGGFTGPLLTKSLLFIGVNFGGPSLRAFDKQTGEIIHETVLPGNPTGTPMTYMVAGRQYISVAVGANKNAKLVTLSLQP